MWDRDLVARLSPSASQVLLSLLLSGQVEITQPLAEFAKTTGLGQRTIAPALLELKDAGLITIIAQPGKPYVVRLIHPELASATQVGEVRHETTVTEVSVPGIEAPVQPLLRGPGAGGNESANEEGEKQATEDSRGSGDTLAEDTERGLLDNCQLADQYRVKDGSLRVGAIRDVWNYAFPIEDYPYQRLTEDAAKRLLVNRDAEWVGQVILDAVRNAKTKISSPRAYIETALANEEKRSAKKQLGDGGGINDELRRLAQLGREQFGEKNKDSRGYQ